MIGDYTKLPHAGIRTLAPYIPGKSVEALAREQKLTDIIKLASNENPLGCSPQVTAALSTLTPHQIATYTVSTQHPLRAKIARMLNVDTDMLLLCNGSDALFQHALMCFALHTNKHMLTHAAAFISYEIQANILGIETKHVPLKADWHVDIDAMINTCNEHTGLIFIANPNNPTGLHIPQTEIIRLLNHIPPTTLLVLDEAYHEYLRPEEQSDPATLLQRYPNLIITRTFSKAYGLAALRIGYAIANPEIIALFYQIQLPFAVNQAAMFAASAALDDATFVQQTVTLNQEERPRVQHGLQQLGLQQLPSQCNFITFDCGIDALLMEQRLQREGVIIRPLTPYGLNRYLRATIGTSQQNTRFLDALQRCITLEGASHDHAIKS
jgi:histidinol-phosphate aminotransferase